VHTSPLSAAQTETKATPRHPATMLFEKEGHVRSNRELGGLSGRVTALAGP
jgi:hypothetical protein